MVAVGPNTVTTDCPGGGGGGEGRGTTHSMIGRLRPNIIGQVLIANCEFYLELAFNRFTK